MKVIVSIAAYMHTEMTKRCVDSVLTTTDCDIVLSINGNPNMLRVFEDQIVNGYGQSRVKLVWYNTNQGFQVPHTNAFNMYESDVFVLLNNDVIVYDNWLKALLKPIEEDSNVALVGPFGNCCSIDQSFHGFPGGSFEYLEGSILACRSDLIKQHGLFSPYLEFAYGEDSDLSLRMRRMGYSLSRVHMRFKHEGQQTSKMVPNIRQIQDKNHATLRRVWSHYLKHRTFDHPIVVKRTEAIGDVLLLTPILRAMRQQRPMSQLYVETKFPELFDRNPDVRQAFKKASIEGNAQLINLDMSYEGKVNTHILDAYADKAGVTLTDRKLFYQPSDQAVEWAYKKLSPKNNPRCVMHYGPTTWVGKNWPMERFGAIAAWLMAQGWDVIQIGAGRPNEIESSLDLRSKTDFDKSAAILSLSQLFVGVDSFPLHLAMSQRVPAVGIFGATLPQFIFTEGVAVGVHADPKEVRCVGERHRVSGVTHVTCNGDCVRAVGVHMVKEAILSLIGADQASDVGPGVVPAHDLRPLSEVPTLADNPK